MKSILNRSGEKKQLTKTKR